MDTAGAVASPPVEVSSTDTPRVGSPKNPFERYLRNTFSWLDKNDSDFISDNEDFDDEDLFDMEDLWNTVSAELKKRDENDIAKIKTEILEAHKEVSVAGIPQLTFRLSEHEIFGGIFDIDKFPIPPLDDLKKLVMPTITHGQTRHGGTVAGPVDVGPALNKAKADTKEVNKDVEARKSSDLDTQFVFVQDVSTREKKVLSLKRGEAVPPGYQLTTITGDVPTLPDELASFSPDALQKAIIGVASTARNPAASSPIKSSPGPSRRRSSIVGKKPSPGLMKAHGDYKKADKEKPKLVYKKQSPNAQKVVSMINTTVAENDNETGIKGMEIDKAPSNQNRNIVRSYPAAKSKAAVIIRSNTDIASPIEPSAPPSLPVPSKPGPSDPTGKDINTANSAVTDESAEVFYGCKVCGKTFPAYDDNKFRKHLLISHAEEFDEDDISVFEDCKVISNEIRTCKRCHQRVINRFEDHQMKCLPFVSLDSAFEISNIVSSDSLHKFECGLCPNRYSARYELKQHIQQHHQQVARRAILDPEFRCSSCLKRFDNSFALIKHCATCMTKRPRQSTLRELARSAACCDICNKTHVNIAETFNCYFEKNYRRCIFCLAIFKSKIVFYRHLHKFHSLQMCITSKKFKIACPVCPDNPSHIIVQIAQHMVTQHLSPMLCTSKQGIPMPLPIQQKQPHVLKRSPVRPGFRKIALAVKTSTKANSNTPQSTAIIGGRNIENAKRTVRPPMVSSGPLRNNKGLVSLSFMMTRPVMPVGSFAGGLGPTGVGMLNGTPRIPGQSQPPRFSVNPTLPPFVSVTSNALNSMTNGTGIVPCSSSAQLQPQLQQLGHPIFILETGGGFLGQAAIGVRTIGAISQPGHYQIIRGIETSNPPYPTISSNNIGN